MSEPSLRFAARSHIGKVRRNNEDSGYASSQLLVVADGMGGHEAGELASAATIGAVVSALGDGFEVDTALGLLSDAVITSGEYIADVVARNREFAGMGTTMTALALCNEQVAIAHVGDSRAYLLRDGELQQLTKDHTFVQSLVDAGEITREQAAVHPRRNLMMRAIDGIHAVDVDLSVREARVGDRLLLCSDGLCGVLGDDDIVAALATPDIVNAVSRLIDETLDAGAPDNITVVVADIIDGTDGADAVVIGAAAESDTHARLPGVNLPEEPQLAVIETEPKFVKPRKLPVRTLGIAAGAALVLLGLGSFWLSNQWYLGVHEPDKYVAIYQGVPVAGLSRVVEITPLDAATLPDFEQQQVVATINSPTLDEARTTLAQLTARATACQTTPSMPGCPVASP
jgi:protein phosphatase